MSVYFLYRINPEFDGFLPSRIHGRAVDNVLSYNWRAYIENIQRGDIILTYFTGSGCVPGIYAIAEVRAVDLDQTAGNVTARLLHYSGDSRAPLLPKRGNEELFQQLRTRARGAEVVIPDSLERQIYEVLSGIEPVIAETRARNIVLPGGDTLHTRRLADVPPINPRTHLAERLREELVIPAYWIRPHQASWMSNAPHWLTFITRVFGKFKAGDLSRLAELSTALTNQVFCVSADPQERLGVVIGVPLSAHKREQREVDRVAALAQVVAAGLDVPYANALHLGGNVSRRNYKNAFGSDRWANRRFVNDYRANLSVTRSAALVDCLRRGKEILLIDDVYTDGLTTSTITAFLKAEFPDMDVKVWVATLGIMAKMANIDADLAERWR